MDVNNLSNNLQESLSLALNQVGLSLINFLSQFLIALLVLLIGWFISRWAKAAVKGLFEAVNLGKALKDSPLERFFAKAEISLKIEEFAGEVVRWMVIYLFLIAAFNAAGMETISIFLLQVLSYFPRLLSALFIIILGILAAGLVESVTKSAIISVDPPTARMAGKISSYTVMVLVVLIALGELGIAEKYIITLFTGFVALITLAVGLSFGLGAKDLVGEVLRHWYEGYRKQVKKKSD